MKITIRSNRKKNWWETFADELWLKSDDVGAEEAIFIKKALHLRKGAVVLDAPCGAGRIGIHLARAGCQVTGVDLGKTFIKRAQVRFKHEGYFGRFICMDLRDMDFVEEFHGIFSWLGSFGYFSDVENRGVMERYVRALRRGGWLLIDQINREWVLRHFVSSRKMGNVITRSKWNSLTQRVESDWIIEQNGKEQHNRTSIRLYTRSQMQSLFEKCGLEVEKVYGSRNGEPYSRSSKRLIMVGRKPSPI